MRKSRTFSNAADTTSKAVPSRCLRIATHESGHAIVAIHFGFPIERVVLSTEGCGASRICAGGETTFRENPTNFTFRDMRSQFAVASVFLAGEVSEFILTKRRVSNGADPDWKLVQDELAPTCFGDRECFYHLALHLWHRTKCLLRQEWPKVRAVADALKKRRSLTGDEVRRILDRVSRV